MSAFIWWWTLSSSLCSLVAAIIARGAFGTGSTQLIQIAFIIHWISLGLVQWKVLTPYISNAYVWGLVTIVGGIISSFLLAAGWALAFGFALRNVSFNFGSSSNSSNGDFLISLILAILFLFGSGFLLGWLQKLVLQSSISSINTNHLAWISGFIWLLITPLLGIVYFSLARYQPWFYILLITIFAILANLAKGFVIRQILSSHGLLSEDVLSVKMIVRISVLLAIALSFAYPIRYKILEKIGFTEVLHGAVSKGKINAQKYLDGGGNPNGISKYNYSLLHTATGKENLSLMKLLISRGADINIKGNHQETPLHKAKGKSTAELLLANGAKVNAQNKNGNTPLHYMWTLDLEVVEVLLKYGADPNIPGFDGQTPLYYVRNSEQVRMLLENGADPNVKDKDGDTPLHATYRAEKIEVSEKIEIAEILIHYGADVNAKNKHGNTPLYNIASGSSLQLANLLIDANANVNVVNNAGYNVLHNTYKNTMGELLIQYGANVNARDNQGKTPLHYAVRREEIAKLLIENGADVNAKDNKGKTPMNYTDNKEIVKLLIENDADVNVKNN